jgi:hypothetical protein
MGGLAGVVFFLFGAKRSVLATTNKLPVSAGVGLLVAWIYDSYAPTEIA